MGIKVGIDASRNRSGGAKAHIIGIINALKENPPVGVDEVHIWSYQELLDKLPDYPWIMKHAPVELKGNLLKQLSWQNKKLPQEAKKFHIDILLNTDAGTVCRFLPSVTMSRDMLSYEKGEMERFGLFSFQRLRLLALKYVQNYSLKNSTAAIFLTNYASTTIQKSCGRIENFKIIPHGISENFRKNSKIWSNAERNNKPIECIYVSNVERYKHQINVAKAINFLKKSKNFNIKIKFVGGGRGKSQRELQQFIKENDPENNFISQLDFVEHSKLPELIYSSDLFIFASSCENMPNTLIEGMCSGLPIVCSNRGPMPEVLKDGGLYFDPENYLDIAGSIEKVILDENLRTKIGLKSLKLSQDFSWKRCSKETFNYLLEIFNDENRKTIPNLQ